MNNELSQILLDLNQFGLVWAKFWWLVILVVGWSIVWKGIALWQAARNSQRNWFIVLLIVNTVGLLEIIYLISFKKSKSVN